MAKRSSQQHIGSFAQRWVAALIAEHEDWMARDLSDDFGIDLEAELAAPEVRGEILKLQIKGIAGVERANQFVSIRIERKYLTYAAACRYPLVLVVVDTVAKEAWYVWLQEWLLSAMGPSEVLATDQASWILRIPAQQTLGNGLERDLKEIARWRGKTQLVLSLLDALRAASATGRLTLVTAITDLLAQTGEGLGEKLLQSVVAEVLALGKRVRGTVEGNEVTWILFSLLRKFGNGVTLETVMRLAIRGDGYSRTGINALGILYDSFPNHIRSLGLSAAFIDIDPRVAYYCAFREAVQVEPTLMPEPGTFEFAGLRYQRPEDHWNMLANRGVSALLDYLVSAE
jgi:hypothetical protein